MQNTSLRNPWWSQVLVKLLKGEVVEEEELLKEGIVV